MYRHGRVESLQSEESMGLDLSAVHAVKRSKFSPRIKNGMPDSMKIISRSTIRLRNDRGSGPWDHHPRKVPGIRRRTFELLLGQLLRLPRQGCAVVEHEIWSPSQRIVTSLSFGISGPTQRRTCSQFRDCVRCRDYHSLRQQSASLIPSNARGGDRGVIQRTFDPLEISAVLPAELGAGPLDHGAPKWSIPICLDECPTIDRTAPIQVSRLNLPLFEADRRPAEVERCYRRCALSPWSRPISWSSSTKRPYLPHCSNELKPALPGRAC